MYVHRDCEQYDILVRCLCYHLFVERQIYSDIEQQGNV